VRGTTLRVVTDAVVQLGGNRRAFEFMSSQPDFKPTMPIREKYNTRAAALYREKVRARDQRRGSHVG